MRAKTARGPVVDQTFSTFARSTAAPVPRDSTPPPMPHGSAPRPTTGTPNPGTKTSATTPAEKRRASAAASSIPTYSPSGLDNAAEARKAEIELRLRQLREQRAGGPGSEGAISSLSPIVPAPAPLVPMQRTFFDSTTQSALFDMNSRTWRPMQQGDEDTGGGEHIVVCVGQSVVVSDKDKDITDMEKSFMVFSGALQRVKSPFADSQAKVLQPLLKSDPIRSVYTGEVASVSCFYTNLSVEEYESTLPLGAMLKFADGSVKYFSSTVFTPQGAPIEVKSKGATSATSTTGKSLSNQPPPEATGGGGPPVDSIMAIVEARMKALEARSRGTASDKGVLAAAAEEDVTTSLQGGVAGLAGLSSFQKKGASKKPSASASASTVIGHQHEEQSAVVAPAALSPPPPPPTSTPRRAVRQEGSTGGTPQSVTFAANTIANDRSSPLPPLPPSHSSSSILLDSSSLSASGSPHQTFHRTNSGNSIAVATAISPLTVTAMPKRRLTTANAPAVTIQQSITNASSSPAGREPVRLDDDEAHSPAPFSGHRFKSADSTENLTTEGPESSSLALQGHINDVDVSVALSQPTSHGSVVPFDRESTLWLRADSQPASWAAVSAHQSSTSFMKGDVVTGIVEATAPTSQAKRSSGPLPPPPALLRRKPNLNDESNQPPTINPSASLLSSGSALWLDANGSPLELAGSRLAGDTNSSTTRSQQTNASGGGTAGSGDTMSPKFLTSTAGAGSTDPHSPYTTTVAWGAATMNTETPNDDLADAKFISPTFEEHEVVVPSPHMDASDDLESHRLNSSTVAKGQARSITSVINDAMLLQQQEQQPAEGADSQGSPLEAETEGHLANEEEGVELPPIHVSEPSIIPLSGRGPIASTTRGLGGFIPTATKYVAKNTRSAHVSAIPIGAPRGVVYVSKFGR